MKKIILNHKSYLNFDEIVKYKEKLENFKCDKYDLILFPNVLYLSLFNKSSLNIGCSNFYSFTYASVTGEINLRSLKFMGINYTLIAHPERRKVGESIYLTREKLEKSLLGKMNTILCVGETSKKENANKIILKQLKFLLSETNKDNIGYLSIAYEPTYLVESNDALQIDELDKTIKYIKKYIKKVYSYDIEVYYGGGVTFNNYKEILNVTDGVLFGKISLDIDDLIESIEG
ncbi:MAG: triose-phosphate isomerase family protein [Bacilli bacterium]